MSPFFPKSLFFKNFYTSPLLGKKYFFLKKPDLILGIPKKKKFFKKMPPPNLQQQKTQKINFNLKEKKILAPLNFGPLGNSPKGLIKKKEDFKKNLKRLFENLFWREKKLMGRVKKAKTKFGKKKKPKKAKN